MTQLIDQPTNIEPRGISCVNLIVTNLFIHDGIQSSLDLLSPPNYSWEAQGISPLTFPLQKFETIQTLVDEIWSSLRNTE